jgi:hypothetical protein
LPIYRLNLSRRFCGICPPELAISLFGYPQPTYIQVKRKNNGTSFKKRAEKENLRLIHIYLCKLTDKSLVDSVNYKHFSPTVEKRFLSMRLSDISKKRGFSVFRGTIFLLCL